MIHFDTLLEEDTLQAITFDFWNTLYKLEDSVEIRAHRIREILRILGEHKLDFTLEQIDRGLNKGWRAAWYYQRVDGLDIAPRGQVRVLMEYLGLGDKADLEDEIYQVYSTALRHIPPAQVEGIKEALEYLHNKYLLAVICNTSATPGIIVREMMDRQGMLKFFKTTVFSDEVSWAKPNIEIFKHTLALLGAESREAVHIGDDALTDVIGSRRAGMKSVWFAPGTDWPVPECTWHIRGMNELMTIF